MASRTPSLKVSKKDDPKKVKNVYPGTKSGSATSTEVKDNGKVTAVKVAKKATAAMKDKVTKGTGKVLVSSPVHVVSFGKGKRVAHVPLHTVSGEDPTILKLCLPKNPAPRPKSTSHATDVDAAMQTNVGDGTCVHDDAKSAIQKVVNDKVECVNENRKNGKKVVKDKSVVCVNDSKNVASQKVSNVAKVATKTAKGPSTSSGIKADTSLMALVAIPKVIQSPPLVHRKHLSRRTVAKYAWQLDRSTADVAALLRREYGLLSGEETRVVERVSDMCVAFKHMTARMREKSGIDVVTEADGTELYRNLEKRLKFVELYDSENDK